MDNQRLAKENINKLLLEYSIPAIIGTIVFILYNVVDRAFISWILGEKAVSGLTITLPIFTFILAISLLIGIGSGVNISIALGEKNIEKAEKVIGVSFLLFLFVGIMMSILGNYYLNNILMLFGATRDNLIFAKDYMRIIFISLPFQLAAIGMNNILRGEGSPKMAMNMNIVGTIINLVLDAIFMINMQMGIKGAAFATVIANIVVTIFQIEYILRGRGKIQLKLKNIRMDLKILKSIVKVGISAFMMQISSSIILILLNRTLKEYGGDRAIATYGIVNTINVLLYMPIVGIYQGSQPIIGYNYGAKYFGRVKETYIKTLKIAFLITFIGFILVMLAPKILILPFIKDNESWENLTIHAIRIAFAMVLLLGINTIGSSYFQSIGKSLTTTMLNLYKQVFLIIGFLYILPKYYGLDGIWAVGPISEFLSAVVIIYFIVREIKRLNRLIEEQK